MNEKEEVVELATKLQRPLKIGYVASFRLAEQLIKLGYTRPKELTLISDEEMEVFCKERNSKPETKCTIDESCRACNRKAQLAHSQKEIGKD